MTSDKPLPCPFCGSNPQWGLTKKTGCQLHGEPIQYVTLGCQKCPARPQVMGGDRYSNGETGEFFKEGERRAREQATKVWNTRVSIS